MGIKRLLLAKSKKSRSCLPRIVTSLHALYPSAEGTPNNTETASTTRQLLVLPHLNLSIKIDTTVSISEMDEVRAARSTMKKNRTPIKVPPNMVSKIPGSVSNIRPGPLDSIFPLTNAAGTIINPARKATPVSNSSICFAEASMLISFFI